MGRFNQKLNELKENSIFRTIKNISEKTSKYIIADGRKLLNLSSNDYLNLSTDRDLILEFTDKYKNHPEFLFSAASARLLTGTSTIYDTFEKNLAKLFKKEAALYFNTGFQCNQAVVSTICGKNDIIFSDKLNHASIVSGLQLSNAKHFRYPHLDYDRLEKLLKENKNQYQNAIIISETVFSMDGDIADIKRLVELKKKYNCMLMLDEAHAFCIFGENLTGVAEQSVNPEDIDIITVTLGKALASQGAVCLASKEIIDWLINKAPGFIFSTAVPSVNIMWSNFLLSEKFEFLKTKKEKLTALYKKAHEIYPSISESQIIPVIIGEAENTRNTALKLQDEGYYVLPVNPPTVPIGTSRLRLSLTADITEGELINLFEKIREL